MRLEKTLRIDGDRLDAVMRLRGYDAESLAGKIDKHPNTVYRVLREHTTALATVGVICAALDCHPFDLLVAEGYPEPFCLAPASH